MAQMLSDGCIVTMSTRGSVRLSEVPSCDARHVARSLGCVGNAAAAWRTLLDSSLQPFAEQEAVQSKEAIVLSCECSLGK